MYTATCSIYTIHLLHDIFAIDQVMYIVDGEKSFCCFSSRTKLRKKETLLRVLHNHPEIKAMWSFNCGNYIANEHVVSSEEITEITEAILGLSTVS